MPLPLFLRSGKAIGVGGGAIKPLRMGTDSNDEVDATDEDDEGHTGVPKLGILAMDDAAAFVARPAPPVPSAVPSLPAKMGELVNPFNISGMPQCGGLSVN